MSHILIQNPNELPLWGLRLLGLSNKNADQIGQFGTGLKESIALMIRSGLFPIIFSGTCRMDFEVQESDGGQEEIHFRLSEDRGKFKAGEWYGLGMHPNFGKTDWADPWMVFREIFCNALDEGGKEMLHHDVTSEEPRGRAGSTRFYIPANSEMLRAYAEVESRLLMIKPREVAFESSSHGKALRKGPNDPKGVQVYHRGVWVQEHEAASLFDYELSQIILTESRNTDWYTVTMEIAYMLRGASVQAVTELLTKFIVEEVKTFESIAVLSRLKGVIGVDSGKTWFRGFQDVFGENAVICRNDKHNYDQINNRGKRAVVIQDSDLYGVLQAAGVPDVSKVLSREEMMFEKFEKASPELESMFKGIWKMFEDRGLTRGRIEPTVREFTQPAGGGTIVFGHYRQGCCYINSEVVGSPKGRIACIEEICHHITGAHDMTREFQTFLVHCISEFSNDVHADK